MGEVYRAHDTKLGREVALKVLPEGVATDPERLKRFEREAKSLAALNHPHIAQIYGFEDADPVRALVMELVPGDSLAARLERGPISLREALELARQIADGLEAAHDKGIIHRDLKPGNIQVTPDGQAKILDFGLAKALGPEGASATADAIDAPTITAGTRHGVILGTAAYMSPEQARGLPVDARADIWAFGGVLYEMLAGARAFPGATATDVLVAILEREPDWTVLPAATPPAIRALLQRCLRKDARQRLHHIADAKFTIEEAIAAPGSKDPGLHNQEGDPGLHLVGPSAVGSTHAGAAIAVPPPPRAVWRHPLPLGLALLALALGGALAWSITRSPAAAAREPQYLSLMLPPGQELVGAFVAVSPDGRGIVYAAAAEEGPPGPEGNVPRLYHRRLAEPAPRPLPNTEGGVALSFSPDGKWLGFLSPADRTVKKIALAGGGPKVLAEGVSVSDIGGGRWTADDRIVFGDLNGPLWQVPAAGGAPELAVPRSALDADELGMVSPVPVKAGFLFSANATPRPYRIVAWVNGHRRVLATQGGLPQLAGAGQLLFARRASATQADLVAAAFDPDRVELAGEPVSVFSFAEAAGPIAYSISPAGTLVYRGPRANPGGMTFAWLVKSDRPTPPSPPPPRTASVRGLRLSPDGRRLLYGLTVGRENRVVAVDSGQWHDPNRGQRPGLLGDLEPRRTARHLPGALGQGRLWARLEACRRQWGRRAVDRQPRLATAARRDARWALPRLPGIGRPRREESLRPDLRLVAAATCAPRRAAAPPADERQRETGASLPERPVDGVRVRRNRAGRGVGARVPSGPVGRPRVGRRWHRTPLGPRWPDALLPRCHWHSPARGAGNAW